MTAYLDTNGGAAGDSAALVNYCSSQNPESLQMPAQQKGDGQTQLLSGQHIYKNRAVNDGRFCVSSTRYAEPVKASVALANALYLNSASQTEIALVCAGVCGLSPQMAASLVREREERGAYDSWEDVMARNIGIGNAKVSALKKANLFIDVQKTYQPDQRNVCNADVATANSQPRGLKRGSTEAEIGFNQRTKLTINVGGSHIQTAPITPAAVLQQQRPRSLQSQTLQSAQTLRESHNSASASAASVSSTLLSTFGDPNDSGDSGFGGSSKNIHEPCPYMAEFTHNNCAAGGAGAGAGDGVRLSTKYTAAYPPAASECNLVQVNAKMWDEACALVLATSNLGYSSATAATAATGTAPPSVAAGAGAGASEVKLVKVNAKMWDESVTRAQAAFTAAYNLIHGSAAAAASENAWREMYAAATGTASPWVAAAATAATTTMTPGQTSANLLAVVSSSPASLTPAMAAANKSSLFPAVGMPGAAHELGGSGAIGLFHLGASDGAGVCRPVDAPADFPFPDYIDPSWVLS